MCVRTGSSCKPIWTIGIRAGFRACNALDIIGDSVYLFHANLFDLTRQTARVLGCDQPDARRVRPCAASLCCGLCCPLSARQDLGRQGTPTPERRWRQRRLAADGRQTVLYPRLPENQSLANHAWFTI